MKSLMMTAAAIGLLVGSSNIAMAADCDISQAEVDKKIMDNPEMRRGYSSPLVRNVRELRDAAATLAAYGKDDACESVSEAITEMLENPQDLKRRGPDGTMVPAWNEKPQAYEYVEARKLEDMGARMRVDRIIGTDVRGKNNETIGEIADVVLNPAGNAYIVLSYGGFLGLGEEESAVPLNLLRVSADHEVFYLPLTESDLERAPRFERGDFKWSTDDKWIEKNDAYFNAYDS
ncbi:MAG: PRC-barrel domain-containing protein [Alphaproteobacteria bacterium]